MKRIITWLLVGVVAGLAGGYLYTSCKDGPLKRENAALKKEIADMKIVQTELEAQSLGEIQGLLEQIGGLQGNIDSLMFVNVGLENKLSAGAHAIAERNLEIETLKVDAQAAIDANPAVRRLFEAYEAGRIEDKTQIFNLGQQVVTWKDAFGESEKKYLAQLKISDNYKGLWEGEKALRLKVEQRLALQDVRIVSLENKFRLTGICGISVAAVAVVLLVSHR